MEVVNSLARMMAAGKAGLAISPLANIDRKGDAYPIMLQQFKRDIGVAIVRMQAMHKIGRLHYIRRTVEEASAATEAHHSSGRHDGSLTTSLRDTERLNSSKFRR